MVGMDRVVLWTRFEALRASIKKHPVGAMFLGALGALYVVAELFDLADNSMRVLEWLVAVLSFLLQAPVLGLAILALGLYVFQDLWVPYLNRIRRYLPASLSRAQTWTAPQTFGDSTELRFRDAAQAIKSPAAGRLNIDAPDLRINENNRSDVVLGSTGNAVIPESDNAVDFGNAALRYKHGWFTRLHVYQSAGQASSPPKAAELEAAFGAALGEGFIGTIVGRDSSVWLCMTSGNRWHCLPMETLSD